MSNIIICAFDRTLPSGLLGIADLFSLSGLNFLQKENNKNKNQKTWKPNVIMASQNGMPVIDGHGRSVNVDADFSSIKNCDAIIIPGFVPNTKGHPPDSIINQDTRKWFRKQYEQGALMCGSCSGVFALGEAQLLNKNRCTTTWWLHDELKQRFPKAQAVWASDLIAEKRIITAGGPLSWVNITLEVVKELAGTEVAKLMADFSVVDTVPKSQNLHVPPGYLISIDPFLAEAEYAIRKAHYQHMSAQDLAQMMAVSTRTLNRKLKTLTGETPKVFIDNIRINYACTLFNSANKSIKDISLALGYSDDTVFRRLFKKQMKMTPTAYRQRVKT